MFQVIRNVDMLNTVTHTAVVPDIMFGDEYGNRMAVLMEDACYVLYMLRKDTDKYIPQFAWPPEIIGAVFAHIG